MHDETEKIPPFVQDYLNKMEHEGYADFVKLSRAFHQERKDYPGKHATQSAHLANFNRATGKNKTLNYEDGLKRIDADYRKKAFETARKHGYDGPDPNQPSDKEFSKQGEKFQSMIDQVRERQQTKTVQPGQQQEAVADTETTHIETLKNQAAYQQNPSKVKFKGMEQQEPSGTDEQGREQQRAAFLEQIKKTREQQMQRQDKQREI